MLEGTTVLVTGASQGIGQVIAEHAAREGANVSLVARSEGIAETADRIQSPERTRQVRADVTEEVQVERAVEQTVDEFGGLDCVVNNAGIAGPTAPVEDVSVEAWQETMAVNVMGPFLLAKHAVPYLRRSGAPSIINISSISGKRPLTHRTPYTASKMAVIGLTRTLAFELGKEGIRVNAICPGGTEGPRIDRVLENQAEKRGITFEEAKRQVFTDDAALGVLTEPADVAEAVVFLASDRAKHITAQDINVDAGTAWY